VATPPRVAIVPPMTVPYTAAERHALERSLAGADPACPRCAGPLERRDVARPAGVAYDRDRVWIGCVRCGAQAVVDRSRIERARRAE
jgi:hypothetical protein